MPTLKQWISEFLPCKSLTERSRKQRLKNSKMILKRSRRQRDSKCDLGTNFVKSAIFLEKTSCGLIGFTSKMTRGIFATDVTTAAYKHGNCNACGLSWDDLVLCAEAVGKEYEWEILCLQESLKHCETQIIRQIEVSFVDKGLLGVHPRFVSTNKLAIVWGRQGSGMIMLYLGLIWFLRFWSGLFAQFSNDVYADALSDITKAFCELSGANNRSYVALGVLISIASWGGAKESPESSAKVKDLVKLKKLEIYRFLAKQGMKIASVFMDIGLTRFLPSDLQGHHPSQIDGVVVSNALALRYVGKAPFTTKHLLIMPLLALRLLPGRLREKNVHKVSLRELLVENVVRKVPRPGRPGVQKISGNECEMLCLKKNTIDGFAHTTLNIAMENASGSQDLRKKIPNIYSRA